MFQPDLDVVGCVEAADAGPDDDTVQVFLFFSHGEDWTSV